MRRIRWAEARHRFAGTVRSEYVEVPRDPVQNIRRMFNIIVHNELQHHLGMRKKCL